MEIFKHKNGYLYTLKEVFKTGINNYEKFKQVEATPLDQNAPKMLYVSSIGGEVDLSDFEKTTMK